MNPGYVYIAINESYGERVKIGKSRRPPRKRARELSSATGVPTRFHIAYQEHVSDCDLAERTIHSRLEYCRVNRRREFFELQLKDAIRVVADVANEVGKARNEGRINECEIIYALVLRSLAFLMTNQLEEAITTASNAITMWLEENGGYNLYIPTLGFSVDREGDEVIARFRSIFSAEPIKSSHPLLAARVKYFPGELAPSYEIVTHGDGIERRISSPDRLGFLNVAANEIQHPAIDNFISDYYVDLGNEPLRVEYYLRYRAAMYRRIPDDDSWCLAYVRKEEELSNERDRCVAEAREIHCIALSHMARILDRDERIGAFEMFYEVYWSEVLIKNGLENEVKEASDAVFR